MTSMFRVLSMVLFLLMIACGDDPDMVVPAGPDDEGAADSGVADDGGDDGSPDTEEVPDGGEADADADNADADSPGGTTVTFTVYTDEGCTQLPPMNSEVTMDINNECNETPKASISNLVCFEDRITYDNHPNVEGCASEGIFNELVVGVCTEFPGPVRTFKLIEAGSYDCLSPDR